MVLYENINLLYIPEIYLVFLISFILCFCVIYQHKEYRGNLVFVLRLSVHLAIIGVIFLFILNLNRLVDSGIFSQLNINWVYLFFTSCQIIFYLIFLIWVLSYCLQNIIHSYEFILLSLLSLVGMLVMILTEDLLVMFVAIELQSLCLYILAGYKRYSVASVEAGLKYFILGAVSSGFLLFGISWIYGFTGMTSYNEIFSLFWLTPEILDNNSLGLLGFIFIFIGLFFKLGVFPFHMWVPDVYQGAPTIVTAFFAVVTKFAIFCLVFHIFVSFFSFIPFDWQLLFLSLGICSILIGSLGALFQISIKRLMAYGAITHVGFIFLAFGCNNVFGLLSAFFYILVYLVLSVHFFSLLIGLTKKGSEKRFVYLKDLNSLLRHEGDYGKELMLLMFSLAGIPPLAGFFSKLFVVVALISAGCYGVALFAVILTVISAFYYIRFIRIVYFDRSARPSFFYKVPFFLRFIISFFSYINVFILLFVPLILSKILTIFIEYWILI